MPHPNIPSPWFDSTAWQVVDLSHTITSGMPVYPGTEGPQITVPCTIEEHGFTEKKICLYSHTGTHMDAPAHILKGAQTLDQLPAVQFFGPAVVIDIAQAGKTRLEIEDLQLYQAQIKRADFILLYSGWSKLWGQQAYFENYPVLSLEAARWLAQFPLKGIGLDMISIDPTTSHDLPVHRVILGKGMVIIENLTNLQTLAGQMILFGSMPLKIEEADGSPVRAFALLPQKG